MSICTHGLEKFIMQKFEPYIITVQSQKDVFYSIPTASASATTDMHIEQTCHQH